MNQIFHEQKIPFSDLVLLLHISVHAMLRVRLFIFIKSRVLQCVAVNDMKL